jgi:rod shape determining protein RodA
LARYRSFRDLDWPLFIISLVISMLGVMQIYSATHGTRWQSAWWKQIIWILIGLGLMWIASSVDYHTLLGQVPILYVLSVAGLLATVAVGKVVYSGRRWIPVFGFSFQISEFVKLVIILMVARYLSELKGDEVNARDLLKIGGLVAVPVALVYIQPDLGTAITCVSVLVAGILLAGLR